LLTSKSTRFRIALALLAAKVAVPVPLLLRATPAGSQGTAVSISVPPIVQGLENTIPKTFYSAQGPGIKTNKSFQLLFNFKISSDALSQKREELRPMEWLCLPCSQADMEPLLRMVVIRTTSSRGLKQLRGMHLDIVRIRPDPDRAPGGELFSGGYIVEAVVTKGELAKLKAMGFEVSEIPEKN